MSLGHPDPTPKDPSGLKRKSPQSEPEKVSVIGEQQSAI